MERFCACAAIGSRASASRRANDFISNPPRWFPEILPHAQTLQCLGALLLRRGLDPRVEALAVAIHGNEQRAEAVDTEFPQRLRMEVVEVHVLDRLDPGGLQRRRPADDGQVGSAELFERGT